MMLTLPFRSWVLSVEGSKAGPGVFYLNMLGAAECRSNLVAYAQNIYRYSKPPAFDMSKERKPLDWFLQ